jgi:hypothetical protein
VKLESAVLKQINEAIGGLAETDPAKITSPTIR